MDAFQHPALEEIDALAPLLRSVGKQVEADPEQWGALWDNDVLRALALLEVPEPYNSMPNCGGLFGSEPLSYVHQMAIAERISRHDPNCVLALPTPGMCGYAVRVLGNPDQVDRYFRRYEVSKPRRSFFAVTEPQVGSDATSGTSTISHDGGVLFLTAHKKLVGSVPQADYGLIFAKDGKTNAFKMVVADEAVVRQMSVIRLNTTGLCGADLGEFSVTDLPIEEDAILGHGIVRGLRDGFFAMNAVFERYRPMVATMAIGAARGLLDELSAAGVARRNTDEMAIRHGAFLHRLGRIAASYEQGTQKIHETSSLKLDAISYLDQVIQLTLTVLPPSDIFQNPGILKRCRDAKAFEYMEGTSNIHLLQAFRSFAVRA